MRVGIFLFLIFPLKIFSQDISGVWVGKLYNDTTHQYIPYQVAINGSNGKTDGFSHTTFIIDKLVNIGVKALKIKRKNNQVLIEDDKFIFNDFAEAPPKGVRMFSFLTLTEKDGTEVLTGVWKTNATKIYRPLTGTVFLEKKNKNPQETTIVKKLIDLGYANQLSFLPPSQNVTSTKNEDLAKAQKAHEDSIKKQEQLAAIAKVQKAREDSIKQQQERDAIAKAEKAREDSIKKQEQLAAIAKVQKAREDSIKQQQEKDVIAKAQKAREDSIKKQEQLAAIAKAQKAREDSIKQQQEKDAIAKAQKAREDSIKKQEQLALAAIAKAQKAREDSIKQQQEKEAIARAAQEKLLHAQQAKEELERQQLAREQLAKEQKVKEELARKQQEQDEFAKAEKAKEELARQQKAQEDLAKLQNANPTAASDLSKRKLETIRTVEIAEDSLVFSLYDNGTVDGDTVSILLNGQVIMPRVGLLVTAISKTIYLNS